MRRGVAGTARDEESGGQSAPVFGRSVFPEDAVACIFRPGRSVLTSGRARTRNWLLTFERRTAPSIEPLMGWTSGDDPLTQVELSFPTLQSAICYAERQGLPFEVRGPAGSEGRAENVARTGSQALETKIGST
jgi:hypothetical protein